MISAILIYGQRGEILVSRIYKDGLRRAVTDVFRVQVVSNNEIQTPLLTMGSTSFLHIRYNNMYVVAVTRHDVDAIAVFELLYKLCDVCNAQLGKFDEAACYRHVSHIYEILDEMVDYGFPQNSETNFLRLSVSGPDSGLNNVPHHNNGFGSDPSGNNGSSTGITGAVSSLKRTLTKSKGSSGPYGSGSSHTSSDSSLGRRRSISNFHSGGAGGTSSSTAGSSSLLNANGIDENAASDTLWRRSDVKHRRNEVYLDVMEKLNMVFEPKGKVISASVDGVLKVNAHLSGVPHCQVDLDKVSVLENSQLHACVDHARFHEEGVVQFSPPEGEFDLLRYRVTTGVKVPFHLQNGVHNGEFVVRLRCSLEPKRHLTNVVVLVPLPPQATSNTQKMKSSSGKAKFAGEKNAIEWKLARLAGQSEASLRITGDESHGFRFSEANMTGNGPIMANFLINMYTCSTLHVMALQVVEDAKYSTLKWVRYLTESGACEARTK